MRSPLGAVLDRLTNVTAPIKVNTGGLADVRYASPGVTGQLEAMGGNSTLFSIVSRTSVSASAVNWRLYRKSASGKEEDRVEIMTHLALNVWNKPNEVNTRQEFVEAEQQHVDLTGEGWWLVVKEFSPWPEQLWPLRPDRIIVVPSDTYGIAGYIYRGPNGERVPLDKSDIISLRMPNPVDPYRGMGPVQTLMMEIDTARYATQWNRNFFLNSAEPGGVIEFPEGLSDEEWKTFVERWRETHKGVNNAHRVATIERGKWVPASFSMRDMQFAELRTVSRDVILEAFGMPKFAVGIIEDVNRASAIASKAWFAEEMTVPRLERFKGALNNDFLPLFGTTGKGVEFDYDNPVPPNAESDNAERQSKTAAYATLISAGVAPDDAAHVVGLPPMRTVAPPTPAAQPQPAGV